MSHCAADDQTRRRAAESRDRGPMTLMAHSLAVFHPRLALAGGHA